MIPVRALAAAAFLAALPPGPAAGLFHIHLERSEPAADSTVPVVPTELRLWFSEPVQLAVTTVQLIGPDSARVPLGRPSQGPGNGSPVVVRVMGPMQDGRQQVVWRTMARDGHAARGTFVFTLAAARSAR
jgi:methionine-rich copper-binding protein CopC